MVGATPSLPPPSAASRVGLGTRRHSREVLGGLWRGEAGEKAGFALDVELGPLSYEHHNP